MFVCIGELFKEGSTIGRFDYFKTIWGLIVFPVLLLSLAVIFACADILFYLFLVFGLLALLFYIVIALAATYKRLENVFGKNLIHIICTVSAVSLLLCVSGFILQIVSLPFSYTVSYFAPYLGLIIIGIVGILLFIVLYFVPGKKESINVVSNKFFLAVCPILILLILFSINLLPVKKFRVFGTGMANTLLPHDSFIAVGSFNKEYKRGDIILHKVNKTISVKRVIGLPNDKVEIKKMQNGATYVFINDKMLDEPYVKSVFDYPPCPFGVNDTGGKALKCLSTIVPEDSYYLLGDNRGKSYDSRYYGTVHKDLTKGKLSHIFYPLNRRHIIK